MGIKPIKRRKVNAQLVDGEYIYYIIVNKTKHYIKDFKIDKVMGNIQQKDGLYLSDYVVINGENYYLQW